MDLQDEFGSDQNLKKLSKQASYGIQQMLLGLEQLTRIPFPKRSWEGSSLIPDALSYSLDKIQALIPSSVTPTWDFPSPSRILSPACHLVLVG